MISILSLTSFLFRKFDMAFQPASSSAPAPTAARRGNGDYEKAIGFINVYIPTVGGGKRKVGTLALNASKTTEKAVHDRLVEGGEEALARLAEIMILEFNPQIDETNPDNALAF